MELGEPLINEQTREINFTNEIDYGDSVRFLTNVIGLWLVQECRRRWAVKGDDLGYDELCRLAGLAEPFACFIDPDDKRFFHPDDMLAEIAGFCRETGQPEPADPEAYARCCFENLALVYRRRVDELRELPGRAVDRVHVLGGGSRNDLLNQFTANALAIPVAAGPAEATALGNVAVQAIALSRLPDLAVARRIIAASFPPRIFLPE
jgi:rhamnulokinase